MLRKKRYYADPKLKDTPWIFTDHDRQILECLMRYRYLRGRFIAALVSRAPNSLNRSLKKLHAKGLIGKPRSQFLGWNSLNDSDIYEITPLGARRLLDDVPEVTNLIRQTTSAPVKQFAHAMMICDTLASMEIGVKKAGLKFIPEAELMAGSKVAEPLRLPVKLHHTFKNGAVGRVDTFARPDGIFGVEYADGKKRLFVLECEHYSPTYRNTFEYTSTLKKVLAYTYIRKNDVMLTNLGRRRFTVLFVFPHEEEKLATERADGKIHTFFTGAQRLIESMYGNSDLFLLKTVPVQEELLAGPQPFPELMFTAPWDRAGLAPVSIKEPPTA